MSETGQQTANADALDQPTTTTDPADNTDRQQALQQLYAESFDELKDAPYAVWANLPFWHCDAVLATLGNSLDQYEGSTEKDLFLKWALAFIRDEAQRYRILDLALGEHRTLIRTAIARSLFNSAEDCSIEIEDVEAELLPIVFDLAPQLAKEGTAKLSTRLYALARRHTWFYHAKKRNRRHAKVAKVIAELGALPHGCEQLSPDELTEMRAAENAERAAA